jgi:CRISPR-associated protein Csx10
LEDYALNRQWLQWLKASYGDLLSKEVILKTFTSIKQATAIETNGVAKKHALRTLRVLKKGNVFLGKLSFSREVDEHSLRLLAFSVMNLRYLGTKRNRGMGYIQCKLLDIEGKDIGNDYIRKLVGS